MALWKAFYRTNPNTTRRATRRKYWQCHFENHLPVPVQSFKKGEEEKISTVSLWKAFTGILTQSCQKGDEEKLLIATCSEFDHYWTYWQCHFEKHLPVPTQSYKKGGERRRNYW